MDAPELPDFATLLQRFRTAAGLSQAALAERAGLSVNGIGGLERGIRKFPYADTLGRLADALGLDAAERAAFAAAARPPRPAADGSGPNEAHPAAGDAQANEPTWRPAAPPVPPTPLIGRAQERAEATGLLGRAEVRLLTLSGPGGVGKTRLGLDVALEMGGDGRFRDGVVFVDLSPIREAALVVTAVARSLGIAESGASAPAIRVFEHLMARHVLLVLDNFEHVLEAAPLVAELLATCPLVKVLATSRVRLRLRGERVLVVPPLSLPDADEGSADEMAATDAVRLLTARMADVEPGFVVTEENAAAMAAICRRLDGLPLALELVAPWARVLPPAELRRRLEEGRLPAAAAAGDLAQRQRTMREAIAWSYDLLEPDEQAVFRSLSVFSGGWTLEAAEAVVAGAERGTGDVLLRLAGLVDKSLVNLPAGVGGRAAAQRFGMLETVREFGSERLDVGGEAVATRRRHAEHFLALAERASPELGGANQVEWLDQLEHDHANLGAALAWLLDGNGDEANSEHALRLANALWPFWTVRGYLQERSVWMERAVRKGDAKSSPRYATALLHLANTAYDLHDNRRAEELYGEAMRSWGALGDEGGLAAALGGLGSVAHNQGRLEDATRLQMDELSRWEVLGNKPNRAVCLYQLARVATDQGDGDRARTCFGQAREIWSTLGHIEGIAYCDHGLGCLLRREDRLGDAREVLDRALVAFHAVDDRRGVARTRHELGRIAQQSGQWLDAARAHRDALAIQVDMADDQGIVESLEAIANAASEFGKMDEAVRMWAAADAWRSVSGTVRGNADANGVEGGLEGAGETLGQAEFAQASAAGAAMSPGKAASVAIRILDTIAPEDGRLR